MNQADFILTLMSVFWEDGRRDLEEFCRLCRVPSKDSASPFNYLIDPNPDQILRVSVGLAFRRARLQYVYSILRGKDLDTGDFSIERREKQFQNLQIAQSKVLNIVNWHEFIKSIKKFMYIMVRLYWIRNMVFCNMKKFLLVKLKTHCLQEIIVVVQL